MAATDFIDYKSAGFSHTNRPSRKIVALTGGTLGLSHFGGAGTATFSFGSHNGPFTAERSNYYMDLLDDAKQIPVILQDMEYDQRRAWQTDGESVILHVILHRHSIKPYNVNGEIVELCKARSGDPSSVHRAMMQNGQTEIASDQHLKKSAVVIKSFRDLVGELYAVLEGLQGHREQVTTAGIKLNMDWRRRVTGYEYMELVQKKHRFQMKEAELRKTCGNWPEYARDINAVILFGTGFGELIQPSSTVGLCRKFSTLPKNKDYLAVEVLSLQKLYSENGSFKDQIQITANGMRWNRSKHLFESCPPAKTRKKEYDRDQCSCERIQEFVPRGAFGSVRRPGSLCDRGAVIFGQGTSGWINELAKSWPNIQITNGREHTALAFPPPVLSDRVQSHTDYDPRRKVLVSDMKPSRLSSGFSNDGTSFSAERRSVTATADTEYTMPVDSEKSFSDRDYIPPSNNMMSPAFLPMHPFDSNFESKNQFKPSLNTASQHFLRHQSNPLPSASVMKPELMLSTYSTYRAGLESVGETNNELSSRPFSLPSSLYPQTPEPDPWKQQPRSPRALLNSSIHHDPITNWNDSTKPLNTPHYPVLRRKPGFQY